MIIILIILCILILWSIITFNRFVRGNNLIKEAWSGIDVQLKRRHDLIPNIVESVKGYMQYEKNLFENIANIRNKIISAGTVSEKGKIENEISNTLKNLFAVSENYPQLKANQNFLDLQNNLALIEDHIQLSRRYYNGTVRDYNTRVQSFPSMLIAKLFNFKQQEFFEIEFATQRETPEVMI